MPHYKPYSPEHKKAAKKDIVKYFGGGKPEPIVKAMQGRSKRPVAPPKPKVRPVPSKKRKQLFSELHGFEYGKKGSK